MGLRHDENCQDNKGNMAKSVGWVVMGRTMGKIIQSNGGKSGSKVKDGWGSIRLRIYAMERIGQVI